MATFTQVQNNHSAEYGYLVSLKYLENKLPVQEPSFYSPDDTITEEDVTAPVLEWARKNDLTPDQLRNNCLVFIEQYINEDQVTTPHIGLLKID